MTTLAEHAVAPARAVVCARTVRWGEAVDDVVGISMDRWLILAVIAQESAGDPWAVRVERGFFRRYLKGLLALVKRTVSKADDQWMQYPDWFSASYGLMQVMLPVAIELGFSFRYPTELLDPHTNIRLGVKKLRACFARPIGTDPEPIFRALSRYNGGGDILYPEKVIEWKIDLMNYVRQGAIG